MANNGMVREQDLRVAGVDPTALAVQPGATRTVGTNDPLALAVQPAVMPSLAVQPGAVRTAGTNDPLALAVQSNALPASLAVRGMGNDFATNVTKTLTPGAQETMLPGGIAEAAARSKSDPTKSWMGGGKLSDQTLMAGPNTLPGLQLTPLSPPNQKYSGADGYYAAYTNDGDLAATVMAPDGANVRLIDPTTGQVVAQGSGPQGSQYIASLANQLSQKLGGKANWDIAVETAPGAGTYNTMQGDRTDHPHFTLAKALQTFGPALLGALVAGPMGFGALAGGLTAGGVGLLAGQSPLQALLSAAGVGVGSALGGLGGAAGSAAGAAPEAAGVLANVPGLIDTPALLSAAGSSLGAGTGGVLGALGAGAASLGSSSLGTLLPELTVTAPAAAGAGLGAALGGGAGGALGAGLGALSSGGIGGASGSPTLAGSAGTDTLPPNTVDEITVTAQNAARQGLSLQQMVSLGIPAAAAATAIASLAGSGTPSIAGPADQPQVVDTTGPQQITPPDTAGMTPTPSLTPPSNGVLSSVLDAARSHPLFTASLLSALAGGTGSTGKGNYAIPTGAGTRGSMDPIFSAKLPAPTFGVRKPQTVNTDWLTYATRPEQTFFTEVPQGLARGGKPDFAVRGDGTGRSDSIPAKLSDGEYVMDAETVSLLGDGSTDAGAKKLDQFRVNLRKQKGRNLAKGRFSANARQPEAYLTGGRA